MTRSGLDRLLVVAATVLWIPWAIWGAGVGWPVGLWLLFSASLGRAWPDQRLRAAFVAMGAAPLWIQAGHDLGLVVGAVAMALGALSRPVLPAGAAFLVLGWAAVEALRAFAVGEPLVPFAVPLLVAGASVGGLMRLARPEGWASVGLGVAGLVVLGRAAFALTVPLVVASDVDQLNRLGVLRLRADEVVTRPEWFNEALHVDPRWHEVALAVGRRWGWRFPLEAGWAPSDAALAPDDRIAVARWLDEAGRGGEGVRLLRRGGDDPTVRWTAVLLARGVGEQVDGAGLRAPPGTPELPGSLELNWSLVTAGVSSIELHARVPLHGLSIVARGEPAESLPTLLVEVDGEPSRRIDLDTFDGDVQVAGALDEGPHRVRLRFDNDSPSTRNVYVTSLEAW